MGKGLTAASSHDRGVFLLSRPQAHPLSLPLPILAGMDTTELTRHARVRMQQRGIGSEVLDHLFAYGRIVHDHHGAEIVYFDRAARHHHAHTVRVCRRFKQQLAGD